MKRLLIYICMAMAMLVADVAITKNCELKAQSLPLGLRFEPMIVDFGSIAEDGGSAVRSVNVTNVSNEAITISEMVSTCGCTTIDFRPCTLAPHESIDFAVRYDPMNRPGRIDRSIYIIVEGQDEEIRLRLTGYVLERERTIEELYPFDMGGGLRLRHNFHAFGYLEQGKACEERIGYINSSDKDITIAMAGASLSEFASITLPNRIAAGESGNIIVGYAIPESSATYGTIIDNINLLVDGVAAPYKLTTQIIAIDNFDSMDDISAPRGVISENIIKFGEVKCANATLEQSITLRNDGASPLVVRCVECSSEALRCEIVGGNEVVPGESITLRISLSMKPFAESDHIVTERVRIITNDPMRPMQNIKVTAIPMW